MGTTIGRRHATGYGAITLSGREFNPVRLTRRFVTSARPVGTGTRNPTTPDAQPPTGITRDRFGLLRFRSPLLTEYPLLQVLRCFTSLRTPRTNAVTAHDGCRVPPFGNPRIKALSAAPRGLSRPHTSFIGPVCQGIHHTPLQATPTPTRGRARKQLPANSRTTHHHTKMITKRSKRLKTMSSIRNQQQETGTKPESCSRPLSSSQTTTHHRENDDRENRGHATRGQDHADPAKRDHGGPGTQKHAHTTQASDDLFHTSRPPPPRLPRRRTTDTIHKTVD